MTATSKRRAVSIAICRRFSAALFAHPSPIPVKWAMNEFGFRAGACRSPMGEMPEDLKAVLRPLIAPFRPE